MSNSQTHPGSADTDGSEDTDAMRGIPRMVLAKGKKPPMWTKKRYPVALAGGPEKKKKLTHWQATRDEAFVQIVPTPAAVEEVEELVAQETSSEDSVDAFVGTLEDSGEDELNGGGDWYNDPVLSRS